MKKLSQAIALVVVTTLFATAFTTNHFKQAMNELRVASAQMDNNVVQITITGKRMTSLEKAQFDADLRLSNAMKKQDVIAAQ